jgi:hypothetical protein
LVFLADLHPGVNKLTLAKKQKPQLETQIFEAETLGTGETRNGNDYTLSLNGKTNNIEYLFGNGEYIHIGIYNITSNGYSRDTKSWDKFLSFTTRR